MPNIKSNSKKTKIFYIIFSIVISIGLWTWVAYVGNPTLDGPMAISGIQVEFVGEDLLRDHNLVVTNKDARQLTVYFGGRRNSVASLSSSNIKAVVDLTKVLSYSSVSGTYQLSYDLLYDNSALPTDVSVERRSRDYISVSIDKLATESFSVQPIYNGSIAEGYMAGDLTVSRDNIEIAGTASAIAKIASVTVTLDRDNLSKTAAEKEPLVLLDADGNVIDMDAEGLSFIDSDGTAIVTQTVLMLKEVKLSVDLVECASAGGANIKLSIDPPSVMLAGDQEELESLNLINLGTIDLKSVILSYSDEFQIRIPNNVTNLSGKTTASVSVDVLGAFTRILSATAISTRNENGREVSIITQSLVVTLRGNNEDDLNEVIAENIRIVADLSDYSNISGTYQVPAIVYVDGFPNIDAVGEYKVTVVIS